jgi:hypothetical protein
MVAMHKMITRSLILVALLTATAGAQSINTIRPVGRSNVTGVVFDSLSRAPLAGAIVQLIAADNPALLGHTATSDSVGRYTLDDVPPGKYMLGFLHPMLDSLGIDLPPREVNVVAGQPSRVDLVTPSPARLRNLLCGASAEEDSVGLLIGYVRDARDESPAAGVTVSGEWIEYTLARTGLVRTVPKRVATSGENGWFALCNVPIGGNVALLATHGADSTGRIEVVIPKEGFARREIFLGANQIVVIADTTKRPDSLKAAPRRVHVGNGRISGTVVAAVGGKPIGNAVVGITGGPQVRANDRGEWTITNAPLGTQMIETRAIGFYPVSRHVNIVPDAAPVRFALSTMQAVLDTVRIVAERSADRHMSGFSGRKRTGMGTYFTADDIARHRPIATTDIIQMAVGVRVERDGLGDALLSMRGMFQERCNPAIYIDDHYFPNFTADDIDNYVKPNRIMGIEVYTRGSTPPQFEPGLSGCGAVVIWTK